MRLFVVAILLLFSLLGVKSDLSRGDNSEHHGHNHTHAHLHPSTTSLHNRHSGHNKKHDLIKFGNYHLHHSTWTELKQLIDCWTERGGSWDFMNITIIDNIYLYAPCPLHYSAKNPCAWILDRDALKYQWNPNYLSNSKCLKILTVSDSVGGGEPIVASEKNTGDRMDVTRFRSNTKITRLADFDSPMMCYMLTSNTSYVHRSQQLDDVLLETDNAPSHMKGGILVIGDSISELIASSLRNLLLLGNNQTCPTAGAQYVCHDQVRVDFIRNDWLSLINEPRFTSTPNDVRYENPWMKHLEENKHNYSILILNRGAHYVPNEELFVGLNETLTYITTNYPHLGILWRNTPQGDHGWKVNFFTPPLKEPLQSDPNAKFYYGLFEAQNEAVKQWLNENFPQVVYFDVFTSTGMRRDARYDALHPCVPGPVDTWSKFVYNILKYIYSNAIATNSSGRLLRRMILRG